jgi:ABC-type multidrug transport system fused ATPase/permease subunit
MRGRTSFMIAHRTSTLEACDVLLRIENGRLENATNSKEGETCDDHGYIATTIG